MTPRWRNPLLAPFYALGISFVLVLLLGAALRVSPEQMPPVVPPAVTLPMPTTVPERTVAPEEPAPDPDPPPEREAGSGPTGPVLDGGGGGQRSPLDPQPEGPTTPDGTASEDGQQ